MFIIFLCTTLSLFANCVDLEEIRQDFVLETKKIEVPGYPYAFNPSIVRWNDFFLMSFRVIPDRKQSFTSVIGLIWLDDHFNPISVPHILNTREEGSQIPSRAEDARLLQVEEKLYIVYSDNPESKISKGGFRVYLAELCYEKETLSLKNGCCLSSFEGESKEKREKNWVPFAYQENLFLAYSLLPHLIFQPHHTSCTTVASTQGPIKWNWGELRGGTPALILNGEYLAFFHSSKKMSTLHSEGQNILHYFMGAYTFQPHPPFAITQISPEPIVGANFYKGPVYKPYWHPVRAIFPGGFVFDDHYIWVVYGRQDHEIWVAKLDREKLFKSLK